MSVGEYLALGMDEKGRADSASCGTESPDMAGDAPPALDRGDSVDDPSPPPVSDAAKSLESIFVREALAFRARGGGCGKPLVHYMDGFTIEESDVPFPLAQYDKITELVSSEVLDDIMPLIADIDVKNKVDEKAAKEKDILGKPTRQATPTKVETENESKRKVPARTRRSTNQSEVRNIKPKKEEPENVSEEHFEERKQCKNRRATPVHHPPRRRTNELELLLSMDFGPKDCGRRILDTEKRKSVLDKEKRLSSETGDEHDKGDHADKSRTKQKKRTTQSTVNESPVKAERSRSSVDSSDTHSHSSKRSGFHFIPAIERDKGSGKHDKSKDKEKEKEREKELAVLNTPTVSMRMLPASEDSPEDRCLYCQVSFKEKERSVSTPQYCSTKCRRSYQSMMASEKNGRKFYGTVSAETMKRISGGSEVRPKFEEEVTPPSSSKGSKSEDSSHSKKPFSAFIDASRTATPGPPRGVVSPTAVQ
ncbi:unnamed protein product, partial [Strongylus vulgaris]